MAPQEGFHQYDIDSKREGLPDAIGVLDVFWDGYAGLYEVTDPEEGTIDRNRFRRNVLATLVHLDPLRAKAAELGETSRSEDDYGFIETAGLRNGIKYLGSQISDGDCTLTIQYWRAPSKEEGPLWEKVQHRPRTELVKVQEIRGKSLRRLTLEFGSGWHRLESENMQQTRTRRSAIQLTGRFQNNTAGEIVTAQLTVARPTLQLYPTS